MTTVSYIRSAGSNSSKSIKLSTIYETAAFHTPYSNGTFNKLTISAARHDVFIGAVDYLYRLDENLKLKQEVKTGPALDSEKCPPPVDQVGTQCVAPRRYINNVNKLLIVDEVNQTLIACGTLFHGFCEKRNASNITDVAPIDYRNSVVTSNASASVVAFIAPGPAPPGGGDQSRVLYVAVSWSKPEAILEDVPAVASRKLTDFSVFDKDHLNIFTSTSFNFEGQQRQQFPVRYVYGFSSENFSYMLTVQKKSAEQESAGHHTVVVRVCQNDPSYHSYIEVPLVCSFDKDSGHNIYNILVAAYLGKAGRNLALSLGTNTQADVLFAVFARMENPYARSQGEALCIYKMDRVRAKFTETIKRCFDGIGISGGGHLGIAKECARNTFKITDDYCGEGDSNQLIAGEMPIESQPVLTFPPNLFNLSAIRVTTTHDYTVAFVGTKDGTLIKVSLESNASANIYETVSLVPKQAIEPDMSFDDAANHVYVLTDKSVLKLKVQNCHQYTTCSECLEARDPYCGWCSLENNCTVRSECQGSDLPKRWLPYDSQECPKIKKIIPDEIQIQGNERLLLTLDIQHIPDFQAQTSYKCVFTSITGPNTALPMTTLANRTSSNLQCYTPVANELPRFDAGKDSLEMKLSVYMSDLELVHETVTFFNCSIHKSCTNCTSSQFSCTWCTQKHMCTDNADKHCDMDVHIPNSRTIQKNGNNVKCPAIVALNGRTEILVPAASRRSIEIRGVSLQDFQHHDLKCQFNDGNVPAMLRPVSEDEYTIVCEEKEFNYIQNVNFLIDPLKILWGGGDNILDNPSGITVVIYKCSIMATTCGDCFTIDPKYECGWCNDEYCMTDTFCKLGDFLKKGAVCPNPQISSFYPKSGPTEGGTLVTIHGKNLGSNIEEVQVNIDKVKCNITELQAPNRIICKTEHIGVDLKDKVRVMIGSAGGKQFMNESADMFSFVIPRITDISPTLGPVDGGTTITLIGEHLNAGFQKSVLIGLKYPCTDIQSINSSAITCKTSAVGQPLAQTLDVSMNIDNAVLNPTGVVFTYVENPNVTWVSRNSVFKSGGLQVNVSGENLHNVQSPQMIIWSNERGYYGPCKFTRFPATNITCISPAIDDLKSLVEGFQELEFGFKMDNVKHLERLTSLGKMKVYADPKLNVYKNGEKIHQQSQDFLLIDGQNLAALKSYDVQVYIGKEKCVIRSVGINIICTPPISQPAAISGGGFPEVIVHIGENLTYNLGVLHYEKQEELSQEAIIGIAAGGVAVFILVTCIVCLVCLIKFRHNDDMMKKMRKEMDQLESRVANECKEAFAELQTDMSELTSDISGGSSIPFWDYRTYCMRVLFPPECNDHPVIRELELDYRHREDTERGLKLFFNLIRNKTFLLIFIRTLEANKDFSMKERVNVASLISVSLQTQMEYATEILKTLLAELIEKTIENPKVHPKILLRRNESVAEKMLTNWFTFLLYKFLKECAGEPLFMLYGAIKQQISKGPVDAVTSEARYSLSEDKLIRQHINYKATVLYVMDLDVDRCSQPAHPVKVLDCDTISQVKEKILDALYKSAPFSSRPPKEELDLVLFDHPPEWIVGDKSQVPLKMFPNKDTKRLVLSDEDHTTKSEGDCKRLNTLSHYKVPDGAYVALHPKQTSIYNMSIMSEKSKFSDNSFYNRSPSLNRSLSPPHVHIDVEGCKFYHLVRHQDVESNNKEGDRGSKMVSEIYLPRLLVTKGTLQTFVDDLFERIFSTAHRGIALPLAIKYMFDFLDDQALHHGMGDEVVHIWKSNSLPLRFWVNVIKNPNFAFDIYKSNIVDACLTVIGQTFMDSCSTVEHKLTKDSPSGKLLYAKDIPKYKQWVARYYQDIKIMPAISDQDMTAMLAEESRTHQNEFNTNAALLELYKYVSKHYEDIMNALEDDEFARRNRLTSKLEQVAAAMDGTTVC
ncbi:hypothetical protein BsWGS_11975 [Bradybaena similaris]